MLTYTNRYYNSFIFCLFPHPPIPHQNWLVMLETIQKKEEKEIFGL